MPLIWNNKEYKLVNDEDEWNKLEFVIVRKIRVDYNQVYGNINLLVCSKKLTKRYYSTLDTFSGHTEEIIRNLWSY